MAPATKKTIKKRVTKKKTAKKSGVKKKPTKKPQTQEEKQTAAPKKRMGRPPKPNKDPGHRMCFHIENHLWDSLNMWSGFYKKKTGKHSSPALVARSFLLAITKELEKKLESGEIDPDDPECRLP